MQANVAKADSFTYRTVVAMKKFVSLSLKLMPAIWVWLLAIFYVSVFGEDGSWAMGVLVWGSPALILLGLPISMIISGLVIRFGLGRRGAQVVGLLIAIAGIAYGFVGSAVKDARAEQQHAEHRAERQAQADVGIAAVADISDPAIALRRCEEFESGQARVSCVLYIARNMKAPVDCALLPPAQRHNCAIKFVKTVNPERPTNPCAEARVQDVSERSYKHCMQVNVWRNGKKYLPLAEVIAVAERGQAQ